MKLEDMKVALLAHQDQAIEDAKRWLSDDNGKTFNADGTVIWAYCTGKFMNPIEDIASRFAMIGFRHVLSLLDGKDLK